MGYLKLDYLYNKMKAYDENTFVKPFKITVINIMAKAMTEPTLL